MVTDFTQLFVFKEETDFNADWIKRKKQLTFFAVYEEIL